MTYVKILRHALPSAITAACCTLQPDHLPLMRHMTPRQASELTAAWQAASSGASSPACQLAVTGKADGTYPNAVYYTLWVGTENKQLQRPCAEHDIVAYNLPNTSVVVLCQVFFTLPLKARVLTILHESVHVTGKAHHSPQESNEWDRVIVERCLLPYFDRIEQDIQLFPGNQPRIEQH
jgi:hypothetical protein